MNEAEQAAGLAATPGYRYAQRVGDQLFVAGQVPLGPAGRLMGGGDVAAQTLRCLENLAILLEVHGFEVGHIRHITVHVVGDQPALTAAWAAALRWFDDEVPPATLLGANSLGYPGQLVEIDAVIVED